MVHIQEPEPLEYSALDELISSLTASDEESLTQYGEDESDGYWTADEDGPATPTRLRTSPRTGNGSGLPYRGLGCGHLQGRPLPVPPAMSTTVSSVSSVSMSRSGSSTAVSSVSSVSASSMASSTLVGGDESGRESPDDTASLSEMMSELSFSVSTQDTGSALAHPQDHNNGAQAGDVPFPTPDGEGKTYEIGVHTTDAWWRAASFASLNPPARPRKVRDDRLRQRANAAAERIEVPNLSDFDFDTEAEDSSDAEGTVQRSPSPTPPHSVFSPSPTPPSSPASSGPPSPTSRSPSPPFNFVIPARPYIAPRPRPNGPKYYAVTAGLDVGVFDDWLEVAPIVIGVSKAIFKSYRYRHDAQDAFDRTFARDAVHIFADDEEAAGAPLAQSPSINIPRYAQGDIPPAHAETIVVFRGREIGVFYDWLDCADHVLGIPGSVYNGFATYEAAWNAWFAALREDYPQTILA